MTVMHKENAVGLPEIKSTQKVNLKLTLTQKVALTLMLT